ncbi:hypothetical protein HPB49_023596 [Dermacentor silvarum]|uniref:Uncharacterized protein n=1 Tax=Dermacentor silvarum TaxID=543639 RepID=A0ACB8D0R0_DERSI|nr:hypothetical protein HPB49_023596 [Dermacentor silvarum]
MDSGAGKPRVHRNRRGGKRKRTVSPRQKRSKTATPVIRAACPTTTPGAAGPMSPLQPDVVRASGTTDARTAGPAPSCAPALTQPAPPGADAAAPSQGAPTPHFKSTTPQPGGASKSRSSSLLEPGAVASVEVPAAKSTVSLPNPGWDDTGPSAKDAIARPVNAPSAPDDPCTAAALPPPLAEAAKVGDDVREAAVHVSVAVDSHPRRSNASLPKMQYVHRRRSKASRNQDEDDWNKVTIMETFSPPMSRLDGVKTTLATSAQWSFFPMNVTFETEPESAQERYMQTVVLITMAVTFVLLVVLVTLMVYKRRSEPLGICNTSECIELHEFLSRLLNSSEDICSDFYGRVCNSWLGGGHSSFKDSKAVFVATINERLMLQHNGHGIVPGVNARALEGTHVMQRLYQSCHRYASEKSTAATFTETLESARKDLNWAQIREAHSYRELITLLVRTSLLAGFHTVFALELFDERGKVVVRLSAGRSLLCKLTLFSRRKQLEFILERITEDVNEAQEVAKLDPIVHGQLGCEDAGALEDEPEQLDELLEHMVPDVAATDWVYALNAVLASTRNSVRASDTALSSGVDRVQGAFEVISDHVNVTTAALYLSSHVDAEILFLDLSREHAAADSPTATQFCVSVVRRCLPYAWPLLEARALDLERDPLVLRAMYHKLKEASRRAIVFTWLPEATVATAAKQIDRAALILVADDLHENAGGDVDYAWLASQLEVTDSADFVRLFVRFLMHEHERRLWRPPTRIQLIEMQHEQRSQMTYVAALAAVVVPTVFQSPPMLYSTSVPTYFNYGTVGTLLAASIVEIILPAAVYHPHHSQARFCYVSFELVNSKATIDARIEK